MEVFIMAPPGTKIRDLLPVLALLVREDADEEEEDDPRPRPRRPARPRPEASEETIDEVTRRLEAGNFTPEDLERWAKKFGLRFGKR